LGSGRICVDVMENAYKKLFICYNIVTNSVQRVNRPGEEQGINYLGREAKVQQASTNLSQQLFVALKVVE
jgi:hypothetical protein